MYSDSLPHFSGVNFFSKTRKDIFSRRDVAKSFIFLFFFFSFFFYRMPFLLKVLTVIIVFCMPFYTAFFRQFNV